MDHNSSVAFKKYLDTKAADLNLTKEELALFAMPYMPKPQENPALSYLFTREWLSKLKNKLTDFMANYLKSSSLSQQGSQIRKVSTLQDMYSQYNSNVVNASREDFKENCNHSIEIEALKQQNHELRTII